eukprot:11949772-Heterocapsa_arctica.AAC.1
MRRALDESLKQLPKFLLLVDGLRDKKLPKDLEQTIAEARSVAGKALAQEFGLDVSLLCDTGYQHELVRALIVASGDLDVDVPDWLAGSTPLGISAPV